MIAQKTRNELYFIHPETKEQIRHEDFFYMNAEDLLYLLSVTLLAISSMDNQIELFSAQAASSGVYQDPVKFSALKRARSSTAVLQQRIHLQQSLNKKKEHIALMEGDYMMFKAAVKRNVSPEVLVRIYEECQSLRD